MYYARIMIDVRQTRLITLREAAEHLAVTYQTCLRYVRIGVAGRRLEAVRIGRGYRTSLDAVQRFVNPDALSTQSQSVDPAVTEELQHRHGYSG